MSYFAQSAVFSMPETHSETYLATLALNDQGSILQARFDSDGSQDFNNEGRTTSVRVVSPSGEIGISYNVLDSHPFQLDDLQAIAIEGGGWMLSGLIAGDPGFYQPRLIVQELRANGTPIGQPTIFDTVGPHGWAGLQGMENANVVTVNAEMFPAGSSHFAAWEYVLRDDGTVSVFAPFSDDRGHFIISQSFDALGQTVGGRLEFPVGERAFLNGIQFGQDGDVLVSWDTGGWEPDARLGVVSQVDTSWTVLPDGGTLPSENGLIDVTDTQAVISWNEIEYSDYTTEEYHDIWLQALDETGAAEPTLIWFGIVESLASDIVSLGDGLVAHLSQWREEYGDVSSISASVFDTNGWYFGGSALFAGDALPQMTFGEWQAAAHDGMLVVQAASQNGPSQQLHYDMLTLPERDFGTEGNDTLDRNTASHVFALGGDDLVTGSNRADVLDGGAGRDTLIGGQGDDILRVSDDGDLAQGGAGTDVAHVDILGRMYQEWVQPEDISLSENFVVPTDGTVLLNYQDISIEFRSIETFVINGWRVTYDDILFHYEDGLSDDNIIDVSISRSGQSINGFEGNDHLTGSAFADTLNGGAGEDRLFGGLGADELHGEDGDDYIHGGLAEGDGTSDRSDSIYGGGGNDTILGGYGNDFVWAMDGDDSVAGGFGADFLAGQNGNDTLTGSAFSDQLFGNDGDDFVNGGWGHDRVNGGEGADQFFHIGIFNHGSDWIQDYNASEGDVLMFGNTEATASQFQINAAHRTGPDGERAGDDGIAEAFVIYRPTGQIMWALVDGMGQDSINLQIGEQVFDLMA